MRVGPSRFSVGKGWLELRCRSGPIYMHTQIYKLTCICVYTHTHILHTARYFVGKGWLELRVRRERKEDPSFVMLKKGDYFGADAVLHYVRLP
jgi:hypothetical protein